MTARLIIVSPGLQASIQDQGRVGFGSYGVPKSGAFDPVTLRVGNALVGNAPFEAGIEFRVLGPTIMLESGSARIGLACHANGELTKADSGLTHALEAWQTVHLEAGDRLKIGSLKEGATGYLTVQGGIDLSPVLGSYSTYGRAGLGIQISANTAISLRDGTQPVEAEKIVCDPPSLSSDDFRVMLGPQDDYFSEREIDQFLSVGYSASTSIDRMGIRLDGQQIKPLADKGSDLVSDGLVAGAIQIPGNGLPIVLGADCQSIGGYPKIATVISADLHRIGQITPGSAVRFKAVDLQDARKHLLEREEMIEACIASIEGFHASGVVNLHALYSQNLIDGVVDARDNE